MGNTWSCPVIGTGREAARSRQRHGGALRERLRLRAVFTGGWNQHFRSEGVFDRLEPACLAIEVAEIVIHKADELDVPVRLFDPDALAGEDGAEIDFPSIEADFARTR